jgi:uncharacterized repeat protein (TIGR03847 family)
MEENNIIELKPVTHITVDALGPAGERTFYIQAYTEDVSVTLVAEKFQIQSLSVGIEQFLAEIRQRLPQLAESSPAYDESKMFIGKPDDPLFRISEFGLSYDGESDLVNLIAREVPLGYEEKGDEVHFWCTRAQIRSFISWGSEVAERGRAKCIQCGQPEDPAGHFCSRKNGHKH